MLLKRLRDLREDRDLKQQEVAEVLNISQRTYSGYETGTRMIPYTCLIKLAKYYNTSTDYILGLTDNPSPYQQN
ncbi:MAG: helix-turn-helix domain-containing protein [Clostridiales bacterium]|nr:helix-turn-helix domain-containing protein [Clostridiales bacterium]